MIRTLAFIATLLAVGAVPAQVVPKPKPGTGSPAVPVPASGGAPMPAAGALVAPGTSCVLNFQKIAQASPESQSIAIETTVCWPVAKQVQFETIVEGKKVVQSKTVTETISKQELRSMPLGGVTAYDGSGQKLTSEQMWQRLKPGEVIIMTSGQLPEAAFLKVLSKDALLIVSPAPAPQAPVAMPAAPAAPAAPVPISKRPM